MKDEIIVATIDFDTIHDKIKDNKINNFPFLDEAVKINLKERYGESFIKIKGNEGPIAHFHIESKASNKFCCVCIYVPFYFNHEGGETKLSNDQTILLNEILRSPGKENTTIWDNINRQWYDLYRDNPPFIEYCKTNNINPLTAIQPNYEGMSSSIHK